MEFDATDLILLYETIVKFSNSRKHFLTDKFDNKFEN